LEQGKSLDETVSEVTTQYEVTTAHARESVRKLLDDLQSYKLVLK
jgi:Coenzyme PQQ synthesis protein D (PqqD)